MKRVTRAAAIAAASALALSACSSASASESSGGEQYAWDMSVTTGETSTWYLGAERFAEILSDSSDGRITVSVFANDTLSAGDSVAGIEQLMNGDKALSYNSAIQLSGLDDRFTAIAAPFLYADHDEVDAALTDPDVIAAYEELASEQGAHMLGFGENGFRQISNSIRPITGPEDVEALKIRVAGSALFLDVFGELGADPVVMNFSELFTSLQNGTVDGQENSIDTFYANGLMEAQDHLTIMNYMFDPLLLLINQDLYDSLSAEDQKLVDAAAAEANRYQIELIRATEAEYLEEITESIEVTHLTPEGREQFREAFSDLNEDWESKWTPELTEAVLPG